MKRVGVGLRRHGMERAVVGADGRWTQGANQWILSGILAASRSARVFAAFRRAFHTPK